MKKIIYLVLLLLLGIRLYDEIEYTPRGVGEKIPLNIQVYHGRAFARRGYRKFYAKLGKLENGNYRGVFQIIEKDRDFYQLEVLELYKKEENFCKRYMKSCVETISKSRDPSFQHFLEAVLLGESWTLFREDKKLYQYVGLSHLLAMSGLHISLFFLLLDQILLFFKISKKSRNYTKIFFSSFYFWGVFLSPSFFRAYVMGICYLLATCLGEKISKGKLLFLSLWIVLMQDPNHLINPSFQLSYLAVFTIFYIVPFFQENVKENKFLSYAVFTFSIQIVTTPLLMASFGSLPCLSFFVNLLLLPLGTGLILMSFFCFFLEIFHLSFFLPFLLEVFFQIFYDLLEVLGKIPYLTIFLERKISCEIVFFFYVFLFATVFFLTGKRKNLKRNEMEGKI